MVEHVSERWIAQVREVEEDSQSQSVPRIASRRSRLLPLVAVGGFAMGLAGCDRRPADASRPPASSSARRAAPAAARLANEGGPHQSPGPRRQTNDHDRAALDSTGEWVTLEEPEEDIEPWLIGALMRLQNQGAVNFDLPLGTHLPIFAARRTDLITTRQIIEHTSHLGARAYEDFLRANPSSDALKAQAFLVALGADDTPGERREWRRADLDLMGWLLLALTHESNLAGALSAAFDEPVRMAEGSEVAITSIREPVAVPLVRHLEMKKQWGSE